MRPDVETKARPARSVTAEGRVKRRLRPGLFDARRPAARRPDILKPVERGPQPSRALRQKSDPTLQRAVERTRDDRLRFLRPEALRHGVARARRADPVAALVPQ